MFINWVSISLRGSVSEEEELEIGERGRGGLGVKIRVVAFKRFLFLGEGGEEGRVGFESWAGVWVECVCVVVWHSLCAFRQGCAEQRGVLQDRWGQRCELGPLQRVQRGLLGRGAFGVSGDGRGGEGVEEVGGGEGRERGRVRGRFRGWERRALSSKIGKRRLRGLAGVEVGGEGVGAEPWGGGVEEWERVGSYQSSSWPGGMSWIARKVSVPCINVGGWVFGGEVCGELLLIHLPKPAERGSVASRCV